ncbi:UNVERIFIED_ORG: beta-glucosidase [Methylobacterium sp. SuP10 SLI 274]|uniref:glycoside hydrolase family 3 N-terminal domain-containing protein n=1 Tax=Methylorubrum extorquens TaxID=408 RepID=UPI00209C9B19|nr:glycoside hydrolase family 3 N-terminal domain-containing protein [Methylorubrum extorquens]MDF9865274.1 beta-glucosidase [Methylorubrum pseudosasae]MDH6638841.1 beta-glucosidase [Methylobacterium sp. SuP10 SLI 274]MDH6668029.1 beta-glucosidase [Methylorubrum zatmanii]MCP1559921.1 beta-glucosidase [Methylorubrum extorquens]MDF9793569.1 beta-glucosidase [Methylorubrum extorquens]
MRRLARWIIRGAAAWAVVLGAPASAVEPVESRIEALLARMTLEEKAGQLNLISHEPILDLDSFRRGEVGAVINFNNAGLVAQADRLARASRLGIPLLVGLDIVHGYRTIFPLPLAMAASFDAGLVRRAAAAQARESAMVGLNWTFSPMADVARDLRWGRVVEGLGEDPWLTGRLTAAQVEGFRDGGLASTLKHFAGYSAVLGGRDYDATFVAPTELHDLHLPPFRDGIRAGADAVMTALTALNGLPTTADPALMTGLLRRQMGFSGLVLADWQAIASLMKHGVARDGAEAARKALAAGVDMDMTSGLFLRHLPEEVRAGRVSEGAVDAAVRRVLRLKFGLGLFDRPVIDPDGAEEKLVRPETRRLARDAARASLVLLQNREDLLPIDPAKVRRIAVVGPFADSAWDQVGPHEGTGQEWDAVTILAGLRERAAASSVAIDFAPGCSRVCDSRAGFAAAVEAAAGADLVVAVMGEPRDRSGEGSSSATLSWPGLQHDLLAAIAEAGKPVALVVVGGRPTELGDALGQAQAVLMAWLPGTEGGPAVAETLFGDANPSGRLPVSWPRRVGQLPLTYDTLPGGRPHIPGTRWTMGYADESPLPLFPFGYGLSYTRFAYGEPEIVTPHVGVGDRYDAMLEVRASVTNYGTRPGRAVAQLYVGQPVASRSRPRRLLKGVALLDLASGETGIASFRVPARDLGYHEPDGTLVVEAGTYLAHVGGDSLATRSAGFTVETGWRGPPGSDEARR